MWHVLENQCNFKYTAECVRLVTSCNQPAPSSLWSCQWYCTGRTLFCRISFNIQHWLDICIKNIAQWLNLGLMKWVFIKILGTSINCASGCWEFISNADHWYFGGGLCTGRNLSAREKWELDSDMCVLCLFFKRCLFMEVNYFFS